MLGFILRNRVYYVLEKIRFLSLFYMLFLRKTALNLCSYIFGDYIFRVNQKTGNARLFAPKQCFLCPQSNKGLFSHFNLLLKLFLLKTALNLCSSIFRDYIFRANQNSGNARLFSRKQGFLCPQSNKGLFSYFNLLLKLLLLKTALNLCSSIFKDYPFRVNQKNGNARLFTLGLS